EVGRDGRLARPPLGIDDQRGVRPHGAPSPGDILRRNPPSRKRQSVTGTGKRPFLSLLLLSGGRLAGPGALGVDEVVEGVLGAPEPEVLVVPEGLPGAVDALE